MLLNRYVVLVTVLFPTEWSGKTLGWPQTKPTTSSSAYPNLHRSHFYPIPIPPPQRHQFGSIGSLLADAAKEAVDKLGYFSSGGASTEDAVADVFGPLITSFAGCNFHRK